MQTTIKAIAAAASVGAVVAVPPAEIEQAFEDFVRDFEQNYDNDVERMQKFGHFAANYKFIKSENAKGHKYELGVNAFSAMSQEEFAKTHFGYQKPETLWGSKRNLGTHVYTGAPLAASVDWVAKGAVTPVKNQGQCGSCWSFSTTGALEGAWQIATGKLVSMSEEDLVDCSTENHGCGGGSMDLAFAFVEKNGICTEASYPYTGKASNCQEEKSCTKALAAGAVTGYHDVQQNSKEALMTALQAQPVSIAVEADQAVFQSYKSGVMTGVCGTNLDHGILAVGFGTESGTDYWMVKNSWGDVWGVKGYGKLERGNGECGILMGATFPAVSGKPGPSPGPSPAEQAFEEFVKLFEKNYDNALERKQKFDNFAANYQFIQSENAKGHKYQLGINAFSDMSPDEFAKTYFGYLKPETLWGSKHNLGTHVYTGAPLAASVDWVAKGAVTPVKNQGQCGSCWSFSTTGALEGAWQIATGKLVSMSEEDLVDCSTENHGCGGGSMDLAFAFVEKNGICTEASYPYVGKAGACQAGKSSCTKALAAGAVTGYHDVQQNSKQSLMSALQLGPVSIAVEADQAVFQSYKSGVMTGVCGTNLDHGILAVGFGTESGEDGTDYWMVKNSWGDVWGLKGYGKLERGNGECGILMGATYPAVKASQELITV